MFSGSSARPALRNCTMTAAAGSPRPTSPYDGALALGQFDHVVRVAADLQAGARRLVPHGEPGGQVRRA